MSYKPSLVSLAQPENHAEAQEVTIGPQAVAVARCVSTGGRPPARITWISSLGGEARDTQEPGLQPGTVTIVSRYSLVPVGRADGVKVTCRVEHESFEEPILLPVTLSVRCECDGRRLSSHAVSAGSEFCLPQSPPAKSCLCMVCSRDPRYSESLRYREAHSLPWAPAFQN